MAPPYSAESSRLWLEPLSLQEHLEDFHELWTDPEAVKWTTRVTKKSIQETTDWLVTILPSDEMPDIDKWAILLKDGASSSPSFAASQSQAQTHQRHAQSNGEEAEKRANEDGAEELNQNGDDLKINSERRNKPKCIGIVGTNRWSDQGMETGYCINKEYWGKGYATESFLCFLDMYWKLPQRQNIPHLVAKVYPDNLQSIKVLRKCNGREGEVLRSVELRGGAGERGDLHCWYFDRPLSVQVTK